MGQINIYKLDEEKWEKCEEHLKEKLDEKPAFTRCINVKNSKIEYQVKLYVTGKGKEKSVSWKWVLDQCGEEDKKVVSSPYAIMVLENERNRYAVSFGNAYFIIDKFSDVNFAFDFARKLEYRQIKTTTLTSPSSLKNKVVNTYLNYNELEFDSGESFSKIKAKVKINEGLDLYKENIEIGNSLKFNIVKDSIEEILRLITYIEEMLTQEDKIKIPVFQKIKDKEMIEQLDEQLVDAINNGEYEINLAEVDIIGATEIFNFNDSQFGLRYKRKSKMMVTELGNSVIERFIKDCDIEIKEALKEVKIIMYREEQKVKESKLYEVIEYIDDKNKCVLLKGSWYTYNDDYLEYLEASINEIEVVYNKQYDFSKKKHKEFVAEKVKEEGKDDAYIGMDIKEVEQKIKDKYYAERYYNIMLERDFGFENYDRGTNKVGTNKVEIMDLYKDKAMFAVKKGNSSGKLCYAVTQSLTSLNIYKHNILADKPTIENVVIWIVLERKKKLWQEGQEPSLEKLDMLSLKNQLDYWKKEVRLAGYRPQIYINYMVD